MTIESGPPRASNDDQSVAQLLSTGMAQLGDLVRQEIALARAETSEAVSRATKGATMLAVGGLVAYAGFLVLLAAAVYALAEAMEGSPLWLPALIVAVVVLGVGLTLLLIGRSNLRARSLAPSKTVSSVKQDVAAVKEHIR